MTRNAAVVITLLVLAGVALARPNAAVQAAEGDKTKPVILGPGGVPALPGARAEPTVEKVPQHLMAVHAGYRYRLPGPVALEAKFTLKEVRKLESHVTKLRARTPYILSRWSGMVRKEYAISDQQEARLHELILEWESENANLRIRNKYGRPSDRQLANELMLNNERLLAAVQAEISEAVYQRLVIDLRYPHE